MPGQSEPAGYLLRFNHSDVHALQDFQPVIVSQPSHNTHIALEQCDQVQPKTGRRMQARPVLDLTISWAQRIG